MEAIIFVRPLYKIINQNKTGYKFTNYLQRNIHCPTLCYGQSDYIARNIHGLKKYENMYQGTNMKVETAMHRHKKVSVRILQRDIQNETPTHLEWEL